MPKKEALDEVSDSVAILDKEMNGLDEDVDLSDTLRLMIKTYGWDAFNRALREVG